MSFKRRILAEHKIFENNERGDPLMLGHVLLSIIEIHNENDLNLHFLEIRIWNLEPMETFQLSKEGPFHVAFIFH